MAEEWIPRNIYKQAKKQISKSLTPAERELVKFYEANWAIRARVPTIAQVYEHLRTKYPSIRQTSVNYYLNRAPVKKALKDRGIPWLNHSQEDLTAEQVAAAITVMNFADTRNTNEKLDQLGINRQQYYAWQSDPQFQNLLNSLSEQNLANIKPTAIAEFTKKVNEGDWNALKYYFDATGVIRANQAPATEQLLTVLIEVLQRHIKDADVMMAIATDIKNVMGNRTVDPQREILGEAYENEPPMSVQEAQKILGY